MKGFHVALINHELNILIKEELNNKMRNQANHYIFIENQYNYKKDMYGEYSYFHKTLSTSQTIFVIAANQKERQEKRILLFW